MPDFLPAGPDFGLPEPFFLRARNKMLDLSRPVVMGILNLSQDSFYAGSRIEAEKKLLSKASEMLEEGALILDLGALSSRPGSAEITEHEEISLLIPGIRALRVEFPDLLISADVYRSEVAAAALAEGADIINNIRGCESDEGMLETIASAKAACILMHSRGDFSEMHKENAYENIVTEVVSELSFAIAAARSAGISDVVADPGFGFSKNPAQNFQLFRQLSYLSALLGCPVLAGISRKSMIYRSLNSSPEEALNGTTALHMAALLQGVHILRVHDVKPAMETIRLFEKLCSPEL
jgi:dihydropteroate synthase